MSKARLVITAVVLEGRTQADVARNYRVSKRWVSKLVARYRAEGEAAFDARSRRPHTSPNQTPQGTIDLIISLRTQLAAAGHDAGPDTIAWHLTQHHKVTVSPATISRYLTRAGLITPEPKKKPRSSYIRFEAAMPNETWQSDFTHYRLAGDRDVEILTWLDDCSRYALNITAHHRITTPIVLAQFRAVVEKHGIPASTLTDNGMVFTTRLSGIGRAGGRNAFEAELRHLNVDQKNSRPGHPTTQGKVERFQQTMKNWLRAANAQPTTIAELQQLLDRFAQEYNHDRPHRSLPHRATPATIYQRLPKAAPTGTRETDAHERVRRDRVDDAGSITLRVNGRLHHIGIGRPHARTPVIILAHDLHVRVVNAQTGELLRELTIDTTRDYQPQTRKLPNP
ncbi:IS481 family transposase [uncultured Salinibacterium sp.]|uniref:IS481 family transposase n=1 Tax=uncultured Salinibacterium sp. TaxID=459274 RepID=UPI0030D8C334